MKPRNCMLLAYAVFLMIAASATSSSQVFAQSPCVAQVSYPAISSNYNPNIAMTVPVSATCSYNGQLFAVGNAYDTSTNTDLGSVNAGLSSAGSGNFNGQLNFYLPVGVQGDSIQISVSIYTTAFGNNDSSPLATTSQMVTIDGGYVQNYQNTQGSCQPGYSYVGGCSPPNYGNGSNYYNNIPNDNNSYCQPANSYSGGACNPPSYNNGSSYYNNAPYYDNGSCQPAYAYVGGGCYSPNYNNGSIYNNYSNIPNFSNSYCQPGYSYVGGCSPPNYGNEPNYNSGYCSPNYSYVGGSCYPPNYSNNYYNNYYAYCPPGYPYISGGCSYPGYYYYSLYRYHGNYYYHWYYWHRHW